MSITNRPTPNDGEVRHPHTRTYTHTHTHIQKFTPSYAQYTSGKRRPITSRTPGLRWTPKSASWADEASRKTSDFDEYSRKWFAERGMRTSNPHATVFTLANGTSNSGVILVRLADTCILKLSSRCDDEMKPLKTLHKNRIIHCARRAPKCDTWNDDSRSAYASDVPSFTVCRASHIKNLCCTLSTRTRWHLAAPPHITEQYSTMDRTLAL